MEAAKLLIFHNIPKDGFYGDLGVGKTMPGLDGGKASNQKMAVVTRWTIINFSNLRERHDHYSRLDTFIDGTIELFNIRKMFLLGKKLITMTRSANFDRSGSNFL